jgi:hypothetical protein
VSGQPDPTERERREPPGGQQNREREGPGSGTEEERPDVPGEDVTPEKQSDEADRDSEQSFPASDPPAHY